MKIKHIKVYVSVIILQPTFSFKPRLPDSIKKDYDAIFTEILTKDKPVINLETNQSSTNTCSSDTSNITKPDIKRVKILKEKTKSCQDNNSNSIDYTLTTTKYVTSHHKSFLIPTVIAVLSRTKKTSRFEKKNTLFEKRNKHLIEKNSTYHTEEDKDMEVDVFNINTFSEELRDMSEDIKIRHKKSEDLSQHTNATLLKSPSNLINEIRSRIKKNKTYKTQPSLIINQL